MLNKFVDLPATHNKLSPEAARNVKAIYATMMKAEYFNLAAAGLIDVAHDLHAHGSAADNALAEHMVAGIAQGLKVVAEQEKRYKRCPHCGRRHP